MATTTHVSEHQYSLIRDMIKSGKSLSDIHDWNNGMSDRIHKRTLKKLYNTIARAEENELTAALARAEAAEEALDALKAGDAVGASTITQFLGARPDLKITMTAIPWGENGLLEAPVILATIGDYLGHIFYTERSTTVEVALRALSAQITQSVEATEDKHHE